jgi:L-threonylcarbamoyladenylate synthase
MKIDVSQAAHLLQNGQVVAVPTETVYGLAACADNAEGIARIYALKGRPASNPLIIHLPEWSLLASYAEGLPPGSAELAARYWPGPMTLILPVLTARVLPEVRADLPTAGFRIPAHPLALDLLQRTGPLVMPSANLSGRPSATTPGHIEEDFGEAFPLLDGGECQHGLESTILCYDQDQWVVVRLGALSPETFQPILGYIPNVIAASSGDKPLCPGQLFRHYAPRAKLIVDKREADQALFILGFKERIYPEGKRLIYLGSLGKPEEVAENLYKALRLLDQEGATHAWVDMDFPSVGLWQTIEERLRRAAQ